MSARERFEPEEVLPPRFSGVDVYRRGPEPLRPRPSHLERSDTSVRRACSNARTS